VIDAKRGFYPVLYPAWLLVCAISFYALRSAPDPARPSELFTPTTAREEALGHLREFDPTRFDDYKVVDAGVYRDPASGERSWIVLCDTVPRSALKRAVVVDLDARSGKVLRTRRPAGVPVEDFRIP